MNKNQTFGAVILGAIAISMVGLFVMQNERNGDAKAPAPTPRDAIVTVAPPVPASRPAATPRPASNIATVAPALTGGQAFRPFKCVNQRTRATVFELGRARNAQFMGQRNNRSFWKVDTPSRTVTFNTDVRDINCAFTG